MEDNVVWSFEVVAPSLGGYREQLLVATHARSQVYPVIVTARCFRPAETPLGAEQSDAIKVAMFPGTLRQNQRRAATPEEFIELVSEVFHSMEARSLLASRVAQINERSLLSGTANGHPTAEGLSE